jgi:hypothetical protein
MLIELSKILIKQQYHNVIHQLHFYLVTLTPSSITLAFLTHLHKKMLSVHVRCDLYLSFCFTYTLYFSRFAPAARYMDE